MKPARQTSSTPRRRSIATSSRSYSSREANCLCSSSTVGTPAALARSSALAPGTLQTTTATCAGIFPEAQPSRMACKFEPEPEASTPRRILGEDHLGLGKPGRGLYDADLESGLSPPDEQLEGARRIRACDHGAHADAQVERPQHLRVGHLARLLDPLEDRRDGPGAVLQEGAVPARQHAGKISRDSTAGDVGERVHVERVPEGEAVLHVDARRLLAGAQGVREQSRAAAGARAAARDCSRTP